MVFLAVQIAQTIPELHSRSTSDTLTAKAYAITDVLVRTPGEPARWEAKAAAAEAFGFAESPHRLNLTKISAFNSTCVSDYETTRRKLSIEATGDFRLRAYLGTALIADCGQKRIPSGVVVTEINRYAASTNRTSVRIDFTMW